MSFSRYKAVEFSTLKGKTLTSVTGCEVRSEEVVFTADDGTSYRLYHHQCCCENVQVEDVIGNVEDLIGTPILMAEEVSNADEPAPEFAESYTWTFYKLATIKGYVTLRWLGTSNGYYGESVDFEQLEP